MPQTQSSPDIFLSRSWHNHKEADAIIHKLNQYDIELTEDVRDIPYESDLPELTKRILGKDYVVVLLSSRYLESPNCAGEIIQLLNKRNDKEKSVFVLLADAKSTLKTKGRKYYVDYWKTEKEKLEKDRENASSENARQNISREILKTDEIASNIEDFLASIDKSDNIEFDKLKKDCRIIIKSLGNGGAELTRKAEQKLSIEETIKSERKKLKIMARNKIRFLRKKSLDPLMLKKTGILEVPLKTLKKKEGPDRKYQTVSLSLKNVLNSRDPVVIFGQAGQGKTILSTLIAEKALESKKQIPYFVCARDILARLKNSDIHNAILSQNGIGKLVSQTFGGIKFCFIIDDRQKLTAEFEKETDEAAILLKDAGHHVVLFSELKGRAALSINPPAAIGYKSALIDSAKLASSESIDNFLKIRFGDSREREKIKNSVVRYGKSELSCRQSLRLLTLLLAVGKKHPDRLKKRVGDSKAGKKILAGKPLSKFELYDAFTDYAGALEAIKNKKNIKSVKDTKDKLAQKAFNDIFDHGNSFIKGLKASFALYKNGKKPEFANDSLREFFLAKYFIDSVNSGRLPIKDAYKNYWSYVEDSGLWKLPEGREWRALLPVWEDVLMMTVEKLHPRKAEALFDIIGKNYQKVREIRRNEQYNPFVEDQNILCRLIGRSPSAGKKLIEKTLAELADASPQERKTLIKRLKKMGCPNSKISKFIDKKSSSPQKPANTLSDAKRREARPFESSPGQQDYFKLKTANLLGEIGHYDPKLSELLKDENWEVRKSAAEALAKTGHYDPELIKLLKDKNFYVRKSAAEALGQIKRHDPELIEFLKDENPETRWRAANILGEIKRYHPELTTLFEDEDAHVRWSVIDALGKMKRYHPKLLESLKDENIGVRRRAADALREISSKKIMEDYQKLYGLKACVMENSILEDIHQTIKPAGRGPGDIKSAK